MIDLKKQRLTEKGNKYELLFGNEPLYARLQELENAIESGELVPAVHGRRENRINEYFRTCSNCKISMGMLDGESLERFCYCPFCGAKMDLEGQK